jgi:hypothetical protein
VAEVARGGYAYRGEVAGTGSPRGPIEEGRDYLGEGVLLRAVSC